jgi:predicted phosphodiesterase
MRKKRKIFLPEILLCILAVGLWAYHSYTKPHESTKHLNADLIITAGDLYKQYSSGEKEADRKFLNKVIIVKGSIAEITMNGNTRIYVLEGQSGGVACQISASENKENAIVEKGSMISIKGRCTGFLMDVNLVDCVIEK